MMNVEGLWGLNVAKCSHYVSTDITENQKVLSNHFLTYKNLKVCLMFLFPPTLRSIARNKCE